MSSRFVDLHMKGMLAGKSFAISRDWPALGRQSLHVK